MVLPERNIPIETLVQHRRTAERFLQFIFPTHVVDNYHSRAQAHEWVKSGQGLLIFSNHFGLRDGPQNFLSIPARDDEMITRLWTAPIAKHQEPIARFIDRVLRTHVNLYPVVTPDAKMRIPALRLGAGLPEYIQAAKETLGNGGILVVFPQAKRNDRLGEPDKEMHTMSLLIRRLQKESITNFSILPVGFGLPEGTDYSKATGASLFKTFDVSIGRLWSFNEMLRDAEAVGSLDTWAFHELRPLVPPSYR